MQLANHYPLTLLEFLRQNKPITLHKLDLLHWTYNQQEHLQWSTSPLPTKIFSAAVREMLNTTDDYTNFSFEVGHLSGGRFGMSMAFTFLNVVLSMTASLGNFLILLALHKVTSIYPPTKLLFRCLAVTDLFVGVITQPLFTVTLLREEIMYFSEKLFEITYFIREVSSFFLCGVSVLTSTAISVDRLLALSMGLRYKQVVTLRRVQALIIFLWLLVGALVGFALILFVLFFAQAVLILISLIISVIVYANIFFRLRLNCFMYRAMFTTNNCLPTVFYRLN